MTQNQILTKLLLLLLFKFRYSDEKARKNSIKFY